MLAAGGSASLRDGSSAACGMGHMRGMWGCSTRACVALCVDSMNVTRCEHLRHCGIRWSWPFPRAEIDPESEWMRTHCNRYRHGSVPQQSLYVGGTMSPTSVARRRASAACIPRTYRSGQSRWEHEATTTSRQWMKRARRALFVRNPKPRTLERTMDTASSSQKWMHAVGGEPSSLELHGMVWSYMLL